MTATARPSPPRACAGLPFAIVARTNGATWLTLQDRGRDPWPARKSGRLAERGARTKPLMDAFGIWLQVFLTDGRVEIDSNTVERTIRPIALNRKNALFAPCR